VFADSTSLSLIFFGQLELLHARTGTEFLFIAVRPDSDQFLQPHAVASTRISDFFSLVMKQPLVEVATQMEAYCLSGLDGKCLYFLSAL
jgi:hypothetical protein